MATQHSADVAAHIAQWYDAVDKAFLKSGLSLPNKNENKYERVWQASNLVGGAPLSSGSNFDFKDYLRLRVICLKDTDKVWKSVYDMMEKYLEDIENNDDGTRPQKECGILYKTRYWQALVMSRVKHQADEDEMNASMMVLKGSDPDEPPEAAEDPIEETTGGFASMSMSTPTKQMTTQGTPSKLQSPFKMTPKVEVKMPAVGGKQNPPSTEETYVNTALLEFLQDITLHVKGMERLDWLADRLPHKMLHPQAANEGKPTGKPTGKSTQENTKPSMKQIMEARVDGFLCRRNRVAKDKLEKSFNNYPLAIIEAKPFVRTNKHIRWQESAEMACWVSQLDDSHEHIGLLQSSNSGRKRRLLISQNRHEIYIIVAEYGDRWKDYVKGRNVPHPQDQSHNVEDLAGSAAFNARLREVEGYLDILMKGKSYMTSPSKATNTRAATAKGATKYAGPGYFCVMNQWGPFPTDDGWIMSLFVKRLLALQFELLKH